MKNRLLGLLLALALLIQQPAYASQGTGCLPTTGTVSGLTLVQTLNAFFAGITSMFSGATAPTTDCSGLSIKGQLWLDTTTDTVKVYDGASWLVLGKIDATNHIWAPVIGGGVANVASATTTNLGAVPQGFLTVTGSTTIAGFGSSAVTGSIKLLKFAGSLTLTNSGTLVLPTGADILTAAGDQAFAVYVGGGTWSVLGYTRADGTALSTSSVFNGALSFAAPISPTALATNTNDWAPTGFSGANVVRASASPSAVNLTGLAGGSGGRVVVIYNVGSFTITMMAESASSSAANRFAFAAPLEVRPGGSVTLIYDGTSSRWRSISEQTTQPVAGSFKNLLIVNDSGAPTTTMRITADELVVEDAAGRARRLTSVSVGPVMTSSGANGLDTGSVPNNVITWYAEYVIYNPTTDTVAGIYSLASTCSGVLLPSGYTYCARVGWNRTDAAATARWLRIRQAGRYLQYVLVAATNSTAYPVLSSSNNAANTSIAVANAVPSTASEIFGVLGFTCNANVSCSAGVNPNNVATGAAGATFITLYNSGTSFSANVPFHFALEGSNIFSGGTNLTTQSLAIRGFADNL